MKNYIFPLSVLAATILGVLYGIFFGDYTGVIEPLGTIFTRLLFMLVPGIIFFSIASSFASIGSMNKLGKTGGKVIGWFVLSTVIASIFGIIYGLIFKPGQGMALSDDAEVEPVDFSIDTFINWIPDNAFAALTEGEVIQIVVLAIFVGIAVILINRGDEKDLLVRMLNAGQTLFLTITKYAMYYAPVGIFALVAGSVAEMQGSFFTEMASFITAFSLSYVSQVIFVYFILFWLITRLNPFKLLKHLVPALLTAFGTVSSAATMPMTLKNSKDAGVDDETADFTIPLGVTFHMDSMALQIPMYVMLGVFAAGGSPSFFELFIYVIVGLAFTIGTAGVPGGGLAIATILVTTFNLPMDVVAWVSSIFIFLDVTGTVMNIWGDSVTAAIVSKRNGNLDEEKYNS